MTSEMVTLWIGGGRSYLVSRDKEKVDILEKSMEARAGFMEIVSRVLQDLVVSQYDPADQDAIIDAIIARFGSSSVAAYA